MSEYCCDAMAHQMAWHCDRHEDPFECPDALVTFDTRFREYGLIIHDGGTSTIGIIFCPWCGSRLLTASTQRVRVSKPLRRRGPPLTPGKSSASGSS
ncbi:DUF6980 family protein [Streptosporangium sandarakinum]|uniref:DUF6980 family protein n=1 Tax=Streptosporangium sandarakinum TaxID=1260955 RepID=UPI00341D45AA